MHATWFPSATDHIDHREHNDPDHINEMPIQRKDVQPLAMLRFHFAQKSENHGESNSEQAYGDVKCMESHERVIRCAKEIRADVETSFVNQVMPFAPR